MSGGVGHSYAGQLPYRDPYSKRRRPSADRRCVHHPGLRSAACRTADVRGTGSSPCRAETSCAPTGMPASVTPQGTVEAGCRVRLKGYVNGVQPVRRLCPLPEVGQEPGGDALGALRVHSDVSVGPHQRPPRPGHAGR